MIARLRLTNSEQDFVVLGDRTLAVWQGFGYYYFTSHDVPSKNPDVMQIIDNVGQTEGRWNFIYYSYKKLAGDKG